MSKLERRTGREDIGSRESELMNVHSSVHGPPPKQASILHRNPTEPWLSSRVNMQPTIWLSNLQLCVMGDDGADKEVKED